MKNLLVESSIFLAIAALILIIFPHFAVAKTTILTHIPHDNLTYCFGPEDFEEFHFEEDNICYIVEPGDTLWAISEFYYGDGSRWNDLKITTEYRWNRPALHVIGKPENLQVGMKIVFNSAELEPHPDYKSVDSPAVFAPNSDQLLTYSSSLNNYGVLNIGEKIYAGPYTTLEHLRVSSDGKNISYRAKEEGVCANNSYQYRFYVNGIANEYCLTGYDLHLLTYSQEGTNYAVRANVGSNPEEFVILSNIGNSNEYDYIDSIYWLNDSTLVYRAQINDIWRVVVNNEDYKVYNYLENLSVGDNRIEFDARHDDMSFTHEIITFAK